MKNRSVRNLVFMALFAALTTVATISGKIPIPNGYFNLGEIMIYTAALTLGPVVGGVAGALGGAIADIFGGYMIPWAPITFVLKGLEGYIVGKLGYEKGMKRVLAIMIGGLVILIGYPLASGFIYGWPGIFTELYVDIAQVLSGGIIAIPLSKALRGILKNEGHNWG